MRNLIELVILKKNGWTSKEVLDLTLEEKKDTIEILIKMEEMKNGNTN